MIGLFAKLIGLGDLAKRVQKIFKKIRKRVDKVVRDLFKKAKRAGRKLMRTFNKKKSAKKIKEENKNGEPEKLTAQDKAKHKKINKSIIETLEKSETTQKGLSFKDLYNKKKNTAQMLEEKYQPQLKKGINLDISFNSLNADEKDGDIDFKTKIAPNNDEKGGTFEYIKLPDEYEAYIVRSSGPRHFRVYLSDGRMLHLYTQKGVMGVEFKPYTLTQVEKPVEKNYKIIKIKKKASELKKSYIEKLSRDYSNLTYERGVIDCYSFAMDLLNDKMQAFPRIKRSHESEGKDNDKNFESLP